MALPSFIQKLPFPIANLVLKILFSTKGLKLQKVIKKDNGRFWIFKVDGIYMAFEHVNWFIDYNYQKNLVDKISLWQYTPKPGDVVIDIGAGLGEEAIVYANLVGNKGKVYAVEANPRISSVLEEVITLNNQSNVIVQNKALSETEGFVEIVDNLESYLSGSLFNKNHQNQDNVFQVQGKPFDAFITENKISKVDFLKVNIEGAERFLVSGRNNFLVQIKNLAISCHDFRYKAEGNKFFETKKIIREFLLDHGYSVKSQNTGVAYIDDWVYGSK